MTAEMKAEVLPGNVELLSEGESNKLRGAMLRTPELLEYTSGVVIPLGTNFKWSFLPTFEAPGTHRIRAEVATQDGRVLWQEWSGDQGAGARAWLLDGFDKVWVGVLYKDGAGNPNPSTVLWRMHPTPSPDLSIRVFVQDGDHNGPMNRIAIIAPVLR